MDNTEKAKEWWFGLNEQNRTGLSIKHLGSFNIQNLSEDDIICIWEKELKYELMSPDNKNKQVKF